MIKSSIEIIVLGITQDGGFPQTGCYKSCCKDKWQNPAERKFAISLALIDKTNKLWWLIEATPDFREQINLFRKLTNEAYDVLPNGIFLTHGHIGHYTGLIHIGIEAANAKAMPIYVQERMDNFLKTNGPWSQLVKMNNVDLIRINQEEEFQLSDEIKIQSFKVPHRDEFTETVGYKIVGTQKSVLFIPDIDKWDKWEKDILHEIEQCDYAIVDGSFFKDGEIEGRSMKEIAHPFIIESMDLFKDLNDENKRKIYFGHLNHTNPVLNKNSVEFNTVNESGYNVLQQANKFSI